MELSVFNIKGEDTGRKGNFELMRSSALKPTIMLFTWT